MKTIQLTFILFLIGSAALAQTLKEQMWKFVSDCSQTIKDPEFEDNTYDSLVDDTKNGYLYLSGSWPTCGCSCENTVGAYKKKDNTYVLLKKEHWNCSWKRSFSSNLDLFQILPENFGLNAFTENKTDPSQNSSDGLFYLDVEIPRIGTETKISVKPVPLGIYAKGKAGLCFDFEEKPGQTKYLRQLYEFVQNAKSNESPMLILANRKNEMNQDDLKLLNSILKEAGNDYSQTDFEMDLKNLHAVYKTHQKLAFSTIVMIWDKDSGRFVIKEKTGKLPKISFLEFLKQAEWYSPVC